ncbi:hypothetical protein Agub_g9955, partial [Astrephomene gubernaculifera]
LRQRRAGRGCQEGCTEEEAVRLLAPAAAAVEEEMKETLKEKTGAVEGAAACAGPAGCVPGSRDRPALPRSPAGEPAAGAAGAGTARQEGEPPLQPGAGDTYTAAAPHVAALPPPGQQQQQQQQLPPRHPDKQAAAKGPPAACNPGAAVVPPSGPASCLPPPPPYRSPILRRTVRVKIPWAEPEQLGPHFQARLSELAAARGLQLGGVYVRRGCVELVMVLEGAG